MPKLYDGHNRTFFYFTAEATRDRGQGLLQTTVPTALERAGDFSRSGPGGTPLIIYEPLTTRAVGNGFVRDPFPNSTIPAARFHPMALRILGEGYPLPNNSDLANNFIAGSARTNSTDVVMMRVDHNLAGPLNRRVAGSSPA